MKIIMTGGGTGGHIYPAIAIADRFKERNMDVDVLFVGTQHGLEKELVPRSGYEIRFIDASGIDRRNLLKNFKTLKDYSAGKRQARRIIEEFRPDAVIGTGGYVCGPVVKTAAKMGIKTYIHEQNAAPGLTNKILEKYVETVFLGFEEGAKYFKEPDKHVVSGNPVRDSFFSADKDTSRKELGIDPDDFVLLSFGGSQGAGRINRAMLDVAAKYNDAEGIQVYFVTGKRYYEPVLREMEDRQIRLGGNIHVLEYINDMEKYLSASDIVVSRSGALAVSEIAVCATPSILIPSPNVTGNHQMFNAKAIADKGGAVLMEEAELTEHGLTEAIENLRQDKDALKKMSEAAKACAPMDASDIIYYHILNNMEG